MISIVEELKKTGKRQEKDRKKTGKRQEKDRKRPLRFIRQVVEAT